MIAFNCPYCGVELKVNDRAAGKQGKCPGCSQYVVAPLLPTSAPASTVPATAASSVSKASSAPPATKRKTMLAPAPESAPPPPPLETRISPSFAQGTDDVRLKPDSGSTIAAQMGQQDYSFLAPAEQPDEMGRLGNYRILKVLGIGAMGIVFKGEDCHLKRLVAVKAMKPVVAATEANRKRFLREAQLAAAIEHDNIVTIYQVGEDRGIPFLAMKLLHGESLEERMTARGGKLAVTEVLRIGREVAEGLDMAHSRGLVHRDIKPANIWLEKLVGDRYRVKIVDFGLARSADEDVRITQTGSVMGTPAYMAPEQANGGTVDGRCDLFSLGGVMYQMSTGQLPFKGKDTMSLLMALATQNPDPPRKLEPTLPSSFSDLLLQLLVKDPSQRVASARAVVEAIEVIERSLESGPASQAIKIRVEEGPPSPVGKGKPDGATMPPVPVKVPAREQPAPPPPPPVHDDIAADLLKLIEEPDPVAERVPRVGKKRRESGERRRQQSAVEEAEFDWDGRKKWVLIGAAVVGALVLIFILYLVLRKPAPQVANVPPASGVVAPPSLPPPAPATAKGATEKTTVPTPPPSRAKTFTVAEMREGLANPNIDGRIHALSHLGDLGDEAPSVVPDLALALQEEDPKFRVATAAALAKLGPNAKGAYPALERIARDKNDEVRQAATEAMNKIGKPAEADVPLFIAALKSTQAGFRADAALGILAICRNSKAATPDLQKAVPALTEAMQDPDSNVGLWAATALLALDKPDDSMITVFRGALKSADADARLQATQALARFGPKAKDAVPALGEALRDQDERIGVAAAATLAELGPDAKPALPALLTAARGGNKPVRDSSLKTAAKLVKSARWSKADLPAILEAFNDKDADIRVVGLDLLRGLGPDGLAPFVSNLADKNADVRLEALKTLGVIGPSAVPVLIPVLSDKTVAVRSKAAEVLGDIRPGAKEAVPGLLQLALADGFASVRTAAEEALVKIGKPATPELVKSLRDPSPKVRYAAVRLLGKLGPSAKDAVPALTDALKDQDADVVLEVKDALIKIQGKR